ncbi:voltage-dependent anion channel [Phyllosticta citrichinensis]|uniref:Voltage-dependent anion channel n=1 Tax=Phyllosticta citrichinensis TaxID=1130410 RepID=A0ABR1Y189_9PEZI
MRLLNSPLAKLANERLNSTTPGTSLDGPLAVKKVPAGPVGIRDRILHFTWAWFTITISTGGLAVLLHEQPHQFNGLITIGKVVYIFNLVLFVTFCSLLTTRFILNRKSLWASLTSPSELFFIPTFLLSLAVIIAGMPLYGLSSTGPWLLTTTRVLFWLFAALVLLVSLVLFLIITAFPAPASKLNPLIMASPAWLLPILPTLLTGTIASLIAPTQPAQHRLSIIVAGITFNGLGYTMAMALTTLVLLRLFASGIPPPSQRPSLFILVAAPAFTAVALIANARALAGSTSAYLSAHPGAADALAALALWSAIFLWLLAAWFFLFAAAATLLIPCARPRYRQAWWAMVFPNVGFAVATAEVAQELQSAAIAWVATAITLVVVVVWLALAGFVVRAVWKGDVLWPGRDEDVDEDLQEAAVGGSAGSSVKAC